MFCANCGTKIPEGSRFCPNCGTPAEAPESYAQPVQPLPVQQPAGTPQPVYSQPETVRSVPEKKKSRKKWAFIGAGVLLVAAAAVALILLLGGNGGPGPGNGGNTRLLEIEPVIVQPEYDMFIAFGADEETLDILNDNYFSINAYGTMAYGRVEGEVYVYDGKSLAPLGKAGKDISRYLSTLDTAGSLLFQYADEEELWLYKNGERTKISEDGVLKDAELAFSTSSIDGSYILYAVVKNERFQSYIWHDGEITEMDKNEVPIMITDDGKLMYYFLMKDREPKSLNVRKGITGEDEVVLANFKDGFSSTFVPVFNADATELLYNHNGKVYLSQNGGEGVKILSGNDFEIVPWYGIEAFLDNSQITAVCNTATFLDKFYVSENGLYYVDKAGESTRITKDVDDVYAASDGKTVFWSDQSGTIRKVDGTDEKAEPEVLVKEDLSYYNFVPSADGSCIYYVNADKELMVKKGTDKAVRLCDEYRNYLALSSLLDGSKFVYYEDGELFISEGGKGTKVDIDDQELLDFWCLRGYLIVNGEESVIYTKDGKTFTTLYEKKASGAPVVIE